MKIITTNKEPIIGNSIYQRISWKVTVDVISQIGKLQFHTNILYDTVKQKHVS